MIKKQGSWVKADGRITSDSQLRLQELRASLEVKATRDIKVVKLLVKEVLLEAGLATPLPLPVRATVRVVVGKASPKEHLRVGIAPSKANGLSPNPGLFQDGRHQRHHQGDFQEYIPD